MAFLRFTRDKRGYEYFYLVQPSQRRGRSTARVLYWFRTPPDVKVGREPFDESIRRELEKQNPDVTFDWRKILETPIPSADAEKWRERRRTERAARAARRADVQERPAADEPGIDGDATTDEEVATDRDGATDEDALADAPIHVIEAAAEAAGPRVDVPDPADLSRAETSNEVVDQAKAEVLALETPADLLRAVGPGEASARKRRRRRRRRGRSGPRGPGGEPPAGPGGDV